MSITYNELERRLTLACENDDVQLEITADKVEVGVDAYREDGVEKSPRRWVQFTHSEWDDVVKEVERFRAAVKNFNIPA